MPEVLVCIRTDALLKESPYVQRFQLKFGPTEEWHESHVAIYEFDTAGLELR